MSPLWRLTGHGVGIVVFGSIIDIETFAGHIRQGMTGIASAAAATVTAIERALSNGGVQFIPENVGGPGVRLKKKASE